MFSGDCLLSELMHLHIGTLKKGFERVTTSILIGILIQSYRKNFYFLSKLHKDLSVTYDPRYI